MKRSVMMIMVLVTLIAGPRAVHAQNKLDKLMTETTAEERAEMQTRNMTEKLSLRDDQKPTVQEINLRYARKMQSVYNAGGGKLQRFRKMKGVSEEKDGELKKVLDASQYAAYEKNKEEMKSAIKEKAKEKRDNQ
ncbi:hypothetical protein [Chryseolinea soli]|uniref:DUF4890 domain-containing protein n=1 Tax=Chryseolinea soli TaxID=2321403 RepID=A0A385SF71_9BACT|nr:hypothetical protein [Chryseolinea soli]AYB29091.1 hypothetical protein D4L85_00175 [Chryseolinea soli]